MISVRNIRHIQVKKVAYCPNLFKAIITYEAHSPEYDESDDIETAKLIIEIEKRVMQDLHHPLLRK